MTTMADVYRLVATARKAAMEMRAAMPSVFGWDDISGRAALELLEEELKGWPVGQAQEVAAPVAQPFTLEGE